MDGLRVRKMPAHIPPWQTLRKHAGEPYARSATALRRHSQSRPLLNRVRCGMAVGILTSLHPGGLHRWSITPHRQSVPVTSSRPDLPSDGRRSPTARDSPPLTFFALVWPVCQEAGRQLCGCRRIVNNCRPAALVVTRLFRDWNTGARDSEVVPSHPLNCTRVQAIQRSVEQDFGFSSKGEIAENSRFA